jgi:hypothetical protein
MKHIEYNNIFSSLTDAIDYASSLREKACIYVNDGTYHENILMQKYTKKKFLLKTKGRKRLYKYVWVKDGFI